MPACLYRGDYGPADPGFDPARDGSVLQKPYVGWRSALLEARNPAELTAMERRIDHGDRFVWCDQGYGWVGGPALADGFLLLLAVLLPWQARRLYRRYATRAD